MTTQTVPDLTTPQFVSPRVAAHYLGLSRTEVYRLLDSGQIQSRRHGSRRLVLVASLKTFALQLPA